MQNIPNDVLQQMRQAICRPEGTFIFTYHSPELFNKDKLGGILFEIPSGQHIFRLERDNDLFIHFYHSSPGTGTRVATIDLNILTPATSVFIALSWTPADIKLHIGPKVPGAALASATGVASKKQFRVGEDGAVYQVGDHGTEVMGMRFYRAGQPVLIPTAKEAWDETVKAIEILATGTSPDGYIFEVVTTNLSLAMLVTGFETYAKKRFLELEQEGLRPNVEAVVESFFTNREKDAGIFTFIESEAKDAGVSILNNIVARETINFQSYKCCKLAFNKAYGLKFGDLVLASNVLKNVQSYIRYRHKIIHVSPLLGMLNQDKVPSEGPIFSNKETAKNAKKCFFEFIEALHRATLALRP